MPMRISSLHRSADHAVHAWLSRYAIDRKKHHRSAVWAAYDALLRFDGLSSESRASYQVAAMEKLLHYARTHVPFYKKLPEIYAHIPPLTRTDIQEHGEELVALQAISKSRDFTGGSSGTPMSFRVDRATQVAREASQWWTNSLAGWSPGDRIAMLWGADQDTRTVNQTTKMKIRWWIENTRWYNAFDMGEEAMLAFHRDMEQFQPDLLVGYSSALFEYARFLQANNIVPTYPRKSIVSSAEVLFPTMRSKIETVFGKKIFDRYGNREFGGIAAECEAHAGLHVNEHDMMVEIDSPDSQQIPGPIQITYFKNEAMPFIRYQTGDMACWMPDGTCPCGRSGRRLRFVVGREVDMIRTYDARFLHGETFTHLLYGTAEIKEFQLIQENSTTYTVKVVATPFDENLLRTKLLAELGGQSQIDIQYVDAIPLLKSGKRKFVLAASNGGGETSA